MSLTIHKVTVNFIQKKKSLFEFCLTKGLQNVKTAGVDSILGLFSV